MASSTPDPPGFLRMARTASPQVHAGWGHDLSSDDTGWRCETCHRHDEARLAIFTPAPPVEPAGYIPDYRVVLPELTPAVLAEITRWQATHGRDWWEPPVLNVPPEHKPVAPLLAEYAAWRHRPAGVDPLADAARWADDLASAFGRAPDVGDIIEGMRSWAARGHALRLEQGRDLVRRAGGIPPLDGEARAAYWRHLLDPNRHQPGGTDA
jgi:hypothetical protein